MYFTLERSTKAKINKHLQCKRVCAHTIVARNTLVLSSSTLSLCLMYVCIRACEYICVYACVHARQCVIVCV